MFDESDGNDRDISHESLDNVPDKKDKIDSYCSPMVEIFPYYKLNNLELAKILENPNRRIAKILSENCFSKYIKDTLENGMETNISCNYYMEDSLCDLLKTTRTSFTMLNLNVRSLDKNFSGLVALLHMLDYEFDVIALTEIGKKNVLSRINMLKNKYECEYVMPKTKKCGGACIFVRKNMKYHVRNDLS